MPSLDRSCCKHNNYVVVEPTVRYSSFVKELATIDCFLQNWLFFFYCTLVI